MNKQTAIKIVNDHLGYRLLHGQNTNFANVNASKPVWWLNIPPLRFNDELHLLLAKENGGGLIWVRIKGNTFPVPEHVFWYRKDKYRDAIDLEISAEPQHYMTDVKSGGTKYNFTKHIEYEFANPGSPEIRRGRVADLQNPGSVFRTQNAYINPYYKGFRLAEKFPISEPHLNTMDGPAGSLNSYCHRRAQQFQDLEYALREMQASMSDDAAVDKIRRDIRERRLNMISNLTYDELANLRGSGDITFELTLRKVSDALEDLNKWELEVYEIILNACDTRNSADLDAALAIVGKCRDDAEDMMRTIPRLFSEQQLLERQNSYASKGGCTGIVLGFLVGMFSCAAMISSVEPRWLEGLLLLLAITAVGWFLGAVIGRSLAQAPNRPR